MIYASLLNNTSVYNRSIDFNRHMAKDWDDLDYHQRQNKMRAWGQMLGVDYNDYRHHDGETRDKGYIGGGGYNNSRYYDDDIKKALENDYDVREYLRYIEGDLPQTDEERYNLYKDMKKDHREAGNGGAFSSRNDLAGVSERAFKESRELFKNNILDEVFKEDVEEVEEEIPPEEQPNMNAELSPDMARSKDFLDSHIKRIYDGTLNDSLFKQPAGTTAAKMNAISTVPEEKNNAFDTSVFLNNFREDLAEKMNFKPNFPFGE